MIKLLYKPLGLLINSLYGVLAGAVVNRVWTSAARADDAPKATTRSGAGMRSRWRLPFRGAIFAVVKAAAGRGAATGTRKVTGIWPGDEGQQSGQAA